MSIYLLNKRYLLFVGILMLQVFLMSTSAKIAVFNLSKHGAIVSIRLPSNEFDSRLAVPVSSRSSINFTDCINSSINCMNTGQNSDSFGTLSDASDMQLADNISLVGGNVVIKLPNNLLVKLSPMQEYIRIFVDEDYAGVTKEICLKDIIIVIQNKKKGNWGIFIKDIPKVKKINKKKLPSVKKNIVKIAPKKENKNELPYQF